MKSVLTIFVFGVCFAIAGCDSDNDKAANDNNPDSIGATDSPTSTGVLTADSTYLKDADSTR